MEVQRGRDCVLEVEEEELLGELGGAFEQVGLEVGVDVVDDHVPV